MEYIAHRGACAWAPENTLDSFALALSMGMDFFELDVQLSSDGVLVVHHDNDLKRTAGENIAILSSTYAELLKYNVAAHFKGARTQRIPRFDEVLDLLGNKVRLNIELKNDDGMYKGIEQKTLDCIAAAGNGWHERVLISSFHHPSIEITRALDPKIKVALLLGQADIKEALALSRRLGAWSLNLSGRRVSPELVSAAHEQGMKVLVYTITERAQALALERIGVDGAFTNNPEISQDGWDKIGGSES
jgi:glycerophosphoryl diester phosphodiesterase